MLEFRTTVIGARHVVLASDDDGEEWTQVKHGKEEQCDKFMERVAVQVTDKNRADQYGRWFGHFKGPKTLVGFLAAHPRG